MIKIKNFNARTFGKKYAHEDLINRLMDEATTARRLAYESFEKSQDDGWMTQRSEKVHALHLESLARVLTGNGGYLHAYAFQNIETGEIMNSYRTESKFGYNNFVNVLLSDERDIVGRRAVAKFLNDSTAKTVARRAAHYAKHGYREVIVAFPANIKHDRHGYYWDSLQTTNEVRVLCDDFAAAADRLGITDVLEAMRAVETEIIATTGFEFHTITPNRL